MLQRQCRPGLSDHEVTNCLSPLRSKSRENKGGQTSIFFRSQILDAKMDHFLERFPLSNAQNTHIFQPAAGSHPASLKIRSPEYKGGTDSCLSPDWLGIFRENVCLLGYFAGAEVLGYLKRYAMVSGSQRNNKKSPAALF